MMKKVLSVGGRMLVVAAVALFAGSMLTSTGCASKGKCCEAKMTADGKCSKDCKGDCKNCSGCKKAGN